MERLHIEARALAYLEALSRGSSLSEGSYVELKREWPLDHAKAARQIAALANAARGAPVMWLVGVDERGTPTGAGSIDLADWWPKVVRCFDPPAPDMQSLSVFPDRNNEVVVLYFDTSARPFVVKNPEGGRIGYEVPWRDGTTTRSARRAELVTLLQPLQTAINFDVLDLRVSWQHAPKQTHVWEVLLELYVYPGDRPRVVIPEHRCRLRLSVPPLRLLFDEFNIRFLHPSGWQPHVTISGPASVTVRGTVSVPTHGSAATTREVAIRQPVEMRLELLPAEVDTPLRIWEVVPPANAIPPELLGVWQTVAKRRAQVAGEPLGSGA